MQPFKACSSTLKKTDPPVLKITDPLLARANSDAGDINGRTTLEFGLPPGYAQIAPDHRLLVVWGDFGGPGGRAPNSKVERPLYALLPS